MWPCPSVVVVVAAATLAVIFGFQVVSVVSAPVLATTNNTMVVSQTLLAGPCVDGRGVQVGAQAKWSTGCNKIVCHAESSGNYTVTHGCRTFEPSENPDSVNCVVVSETSLAYPGCCPKLQCGAASPRTTPNPLGCYDLSSSSTCLIWKKLSSNCTLTNAYVYNFTLTYCRSTCGFCSVSG